MDKKDFLFFRDKITKVKSGDIIVFNQRTRVVGFYRRAAISEGTGEWKPLGEYGIRNLLAKEMTWPRFRTISEFVGIVCGCGIETYDYSPDCFAYRFLELS